ncbi:hypothetical protein B0H14DRAFT_3762854 [Mycena olivaceomarginata]|nr:hypothetical protein B0H14DRAFT_3762854 [Mycena olivaceomarginata]
MASPHVGFDVLSLVVGTGQPTKEMNRSEVAQVCIFVYQHAMCQFLRKLDIRSDTVIGNSLGEISAAAGMAAVVASAATISDCIRGLQFVDHIVIAVFSSPANHVVSRDLDAIGILISHLKKTGIQAMLLNVDQAIASNRRSHNSKLGLLITDRVDHARNPVRFERAATQINQDKYFKSACGPTPTAWAALQSNDLSQATLISSTTEKGRDQELVFLTAFATLTEYGVNPDFLTLFGAGIPRASLPPYSFQCQRHYPSTVPSHSENPPAQAAVPSNPSLIVDTSLYEVGQVRYSSFIRSHFHRC